MELTDNSKLIHKVRFVYGDTGISDVQFASFSLLFFQKSFIYIFCSNDCFDLKP